MFGVIFALVVMGGGILFLRWLAGLKRPIFAAIVPENTTGLVITKPNTVTRLPEGRVTVNNDGGPVTRVLHAVGGHHLKKPSKDPMTWSVEVGEEKRGLLFYLFGIQLIGFFRYLRLNGVRKFRWGRRSNQDQYQMLAEDEVVVFAHYSGQHDIEQKGVETKEIVKFDLRLNLTVEEKFPVKVRLKFADAYAQLTTMVNGYIVDKIGAVDPKQFIGGEDGVPDEGAQEKAKEDLKKDLVKNIGKLRKAVLNETGILIRTMSLPELDFDESTQRLLEAKTRAILEGDAQIKKAEKQAKASVIEAKGKSKAQMEINKGDADRVQKVIKPAAENERTVAVRQAEAYENNETVTTYAPGKDSFVNVGK